MMNMTVVVVETSSGVRGTTMVAVTKAVAAAMTRTGTGGPRGVMVVGAEGVEMTTRMTTDVVILLGMVVVQEEGGTGVRHLQRELEGIGKDLRFTIFI